MKQIQLLVTSGLITLLFTACFGIQPSSSPPQAKYEPKFDYTPTNRKQSNSAGVSVALISPHYVEDESKKNSAFFTVSPYSKFVSNMEDDFEEMLIAKGITLKGPFKTRDEMVYGDKKNSDMALKVSIDLQEETGTLKLESKPIYSQYSSPGWRLRGTFYQQGKIILEIVDPYNGEKFWKKSISLDRHEVTINAVRWQSTKNAAKIIELDNKVYNPIAQSLEKYYAKALETAHRHLDVEELKQIKKEIAKAQKDRR